jgi:hypothetical protein
VSGGYRIVAKIANPMVMQIAAPIRCKVAGSR